MPFAIVEAHEEDGNKELCVVPEGWILDTRMKETILLWPNCTGPQIYKLLHDGSSLGNTTWLKMNCVVKKIGIPHVLLAHKQMLEMSGDPIDVRESTETQSSCALSPPTAGSSNWAAKNAAASTANEKAVVATASKTGRKEPISLESDPAWQNIEQKALLLEEFTRKLNDKVTSLETLGQAVLQKFTVKPPPSAHFVMDVEFVQVDDPQGLAEFDGKLADAAYQEKIYQWLNSCILELRSETRMTEAIDILF
uniref:Uncharacterized protein n=1 Tax=Anopheles dirus TaxID=7168 RepID=A0A182NWP8_9DIPT